MTGRQPTCACFLHAQFREVPLPFAPPHRPFWLRFYEVNLRGLGIPRKPVRSAANFQWPPGVLF